MLEELIEVKMSDESPSPALLYYQAALKPKRATQIVAKDIQPFDSKGVRITSALQYFAPHQLWKPP
jgi:hypothetical protein